MLLILAAYPQQAAQILGELIQALKCGIPQEQLLQMLFLFFRKALLAHEHEAKLAQVSTVEILFFQKFTLGCNVLVYQAYDVKTVGYDQRLGEILPHDIPVCAIHVDANHPHTVAALQRTEEGME